MTPAQRPRFAPALAGLLALTAGACNVLEPLDAPSGKDQVIEQARYEADNGDCVTARDRLSQLDLRDDDVLSTLGFARLCVAGATLSVIGNTVVNYTSSSGTDYTVVGSLARALLPYDAGKQLEIGYALEHFSSISNATDRAAAVLVGHISYLAIIVAKAAGAQTTLVRDDISTAANCTSIAACPAGGMSDADALAFKDQVAVMANDVSSLNLPGLKDLADALNTSFAGLSTADAVRYTVRTTVVPAD